MAAATLAAIVAADLPTSAVQFAVGGDAGKKLQMGQVNATVTSGNRSQTTSVTWPTAFATAPLVVTTVDDAALSTAELPAVAVPESRTTSGCSLAMYCFAAVGTTRTVAVYFTAYG